MSSQALTTSREILYLPVDKISPNLYQPRKFFEKESLMELSKSIRQYGVLQPISVRLTKGLSYELIAGERRLRAAKMAGLMTIPAIVVSVSDKDSAVIAIIENLQRQDLNFIEEAEGFLDLIEDYNFTQEMLAERIGKSQSSVANKIRILKLSKGVRKFIIENHLTERHARALLRLPDEALQMMVLEQVVEYGLTVAKTEEFIESIESPAEYGQKQNRHKKIGSKRKIRFKVGDVRIFANTIKQSVNLMERSGFKTDYIVEETDGGYEFRIKVKCT